MWRVAKKTLVLTISLLIVPLAIGLASAWAAEIEFGCPLADQELDQMRGGYSGFFFGVRFSGYWDTVGNVSGSLVCGGGVPSISPSIHDLTIVGNASAQTPPDQGAIVQAYVGNFNGASGIFQISQSPGSNNIIQNNLTVQITLIRVANESAVPALMNQLNLLWH